MKLIINASTIYAGGALQVTLSFIDELARMNDNNEYYIFINRKAQKYFNTKILPSNFKVYTIDSSPAKLVTRRKTIGFLNKLECEIMPDIVFSVFGPSYWKPSSPHVIGVADGWIYNNKSIAYKKLSLFQLFKRKLLNKYKLYYFRRDSYTYILETDDACSKFKNIINKGKCKVIKVSNTYNSIYDDFVYDDVPDFLNKISIKENDEFFLCYICHNHPNKNLSILKKVAPLLESFNVKFIITLPHDIFEREFTSFKNIINLGPVHPEECPYIYKYCDALFFPSLLETFTASYPEAMVMKKPILTSDLPFAHDICKNAALYFDPLCPVDIKDKILELKRDSQLKESLVNNGLQIISNFPNSKDRAIKYIEICKETIENV